MKRCPDCKQWKPKTEFHKAKSRKDGFQGICKACASKRYKDYRNRNLEKILSRSREYYARNKEVVLKKKKDSDCLKAYGITYNQKVQILRSQNNLCGICQKPLLIEEAYVDHDHTSGQIRGILCNSCNMALGGFKDNPLVLKRAYEYLANSGSNIKLSDEPLNEKDEVAAKVVSMTARKWAGTRRNW